MAARFLVDGLAAYQVLHKWLKDRKDRTLSPGEIDHYRTVIASISETIRLMSQVDEVIEAHGGWPGAFVAFSARE